MTENEALKEIQEEGINLGAGDYVDVKALKVAVKALEEIQKYRALGTVEELREAIEKQKAKKGISRKSFATVHNECPTCGYNLFGNIPSTYCPNCGQAIDWSKEE